MSLVAVQMNLKGNKSFRQSVIILLGGTLSGKPFVGRNCRHLPKNSSILPDKVSPDKVGLTKISLYGAPARHYQGVEYALKLLTSFVFVAK